MGLLRSIKKLFADPKLIIRVEELESGPVVVDGAIRVGPGALTSPIKSQPCVAFFYTASHRVVGRAAQATERPLRNVEVFAPFELELEDGRLDAVPRVPGAFAAADHQELASSHYEGFRATEEIVPTRARVRLHGDARRKGETWVLTYRRLEILSKAKPGKGAGAGAAVKKAKRVR